MYEAVCAVAIPPTEQNQSWARCEFLLYSVTPGSWWIHFEKAEFNGAERILWNPTLSVRWSRWEKQFEDDTFTNEKNSQDQLVSSFVLEARTNSIRQLYLQRQLCDTQNKTRKIKRHQNNNFVEPTQNDTSPEKSSIQPATAFTQFSKPRRNQNARGFRW